MELVNLNKQRKAKARSGKEQRAGENRIKFGRTKQEKQREKMLKEQAARNLEGHRRDENEE